LIIIGSSSSPSLLSSSLSLFTGIFSRSAGVGVGVGNFFSRLRSVFSLSPSTIILVFSTASSIRSSKSATVSTPTKKARFLMKHFVF